MIPKVIHYCWFGGTPLPKLALKCIESWKKYLPNYEIKEWNESNFDVNIIPYTKEAYEAKKYAFVSDYARFWILYNYGGIYFDTDVEVIKNMDDIIALGPYMGYEFDLTTHYLNGAINPGLGLGCEVKMPIVGDILERYRCMHFCIDGNLNMKTIVAYTTEILLDNGLQIQNGIQQCCGFTIYPRDYFNPLDGDSRQITTTENTHSIHHYMASWDNKSSNANILKYIKYHIIIPMVPQKLLTKVLVYLKRKREKAITKHFIHNNDE